LKRFHGKLTGKMHDSVIAFYAFLNKKKDIDLENGGWFVCSKRLIA